MNYYKEEIPKYRKKKQRIVKKSNHKHIYKPYRFDNLLIPVLSQSGKESVWATYYKKCILCGKERYGNKFIFSKEEFELLTIEMTENEIFLI